MFVVMAKYSQSHHHLPLSIISIITAALIISFVVPFTSSIPFILLHGLNHECSSLRPKLYIEQLSAWSRSKGYCLEIGNGTWDSWFMPLDKQVQIACDKIKSMKQLRRGYNIVGLSQGNLVGRGIVQFCTQAPRVRNFISLGGPHAGTASIPKCGSGNLCAAAGSVIRAAGVYSQYVQGHLAPSGYLKIPNDIDEYLRKCKFLPKLNNELPETRNPIYKKRFASLRNLVLIMFEDEKIVIPKESSWFGYYPDGGAAAASKPVLPPQQTRLYSEDWIGLKTLDEAKRVKFFSVPGDHCDLISEAHIKKFILPYLTTTWAWGIHNNNNSKSET